MSINFHAENNHHTYAPGHRTFPLTLLAGAGLLVASAITVIAQPSMLWASALSVTLLTWFIPGLALIGLWRLPKLDILSALLLAPAAGWAWMIGVGLALHWLPGPVTPSTLGIGYGASGLALLGLLWLRPPAPLAATPRQAWLQAGLVLGLLLILWLPTLGAREFFHDESTVLVRARDAIRGVADAPARHTKGPGEIIAAMVFYRGLGAINEFYARLPFALAGMAAVLLTMSLGRRMLTPRAGIWAGLLMAINGYVLALSRMVQYQGPLLLLIAGAALAVWLLAEMRNARAAPWLLLLITLSAAGLVMHYEFVLIAPMLLVMFLLGRVWTWRPIRTLAGPAVVALVGGALVLLVYYQMITNDYFSKSTQFYYSARFRPGGGANFADFINLSTLYNSVYYFVGLLALGAVGLVLAWRWRRRAALMLTLWLLPTLLLYLFIIQRPGTHYYAIMGGWSLLAALPLAALFDPDTGVKPAIRLIAAAGVATWIALSIYYLDVALLKTEPPYLLEFNERQLPLFPTPYDADFASIPRVGIPIDQGWRTFGVLREWGTLTGTYSSNERRTRWYLGDFDRVDGDEEPDYFLIARHVQDLDRGYRPELLDGYVAMGEVRVSDEPRITIYRRGETDGVFAIYHAEDFGVAFQRYVSTLGEEPEPEPLVRDVDISPALTLSEAGVEERTVRRGATLTLVNRWRVHDPIGQNLKLFVHIGEDANGAPLAQWDGFPLMNGARTTDWRAGDKIKEWVLIPIPADMPRGEHPLYMGFYDANTGERYGAGRRQIGAIVVR